MDLQKTNTSNNALSEKKKKILRKVSGSVCYAIFHKFFFNQSIDHSLLYSLLLKNKLQQWKY